MCFCFQEGLGDISIIHCKVSCKAVIPEESKEHSVRDKRELKVNLT